jgi:hypothetical protein
LESQQGVLSKADTPERAKRDDVIVIEIEPSRWVAVLLVAAMLTLWVTWSPPGANDIGAGEGYYGIRLVACSRTRAIH